MTALGYRILGPCSGERKLVDWPTAFRAYAACDARARVESEAYLSAFTFGDDFGDHLRATGSTRDFAGACWTPYLWFDIDREPADGGIEAALRDARKLLVTLQDVCGVAEGAMLLFYSGSKGFHIGIMTDLWAPTPGTDFHRVARRMAENVAEIAGVLIDSSIYDKVRAFRAPNSRHPKTGRYKRHLTADALLHMSEAAILKMAESPDEFDLPELPAECADFLAADWDKATRQVKTEADARAEKLANGDAPDKLNRLTLDFIREGATVGDRHRLCYSAAANLAEMGAPLPLCAALLTEAALDCGLAPMDVRRAIQNGWLSVQPAPATEGGAP